MGLVKGFTDILCPPNLATNGSFSINQRGLFTLDYHDIENKTAAARVKVGDYISDCWYVESYSIDSLFAFNYRMPDWGKSSLRFRGNGKKGQYFVVKNRDNSDLISPSSSAKYMTAAMTINIANNSIPVIGHVNSRHWASSISNPIDSRNPLRSGSHELVMVGLRQSTGNSSATPGQGAYFSVMLMADGEFDFTVSNFRELDGGYVNPPQQMNIPLADDLLRCKRYYQTGYATKIGGYRDNGTQYYMGVEHRFEVEMAGVPSVSVTLLDMYEAGSNTSVTANYSFSVSQTVKERFIAVAIKAAGGSAPDYMVFGWEATL